MHKSAWDWVQSITVPSSISVQVYHDCATTYVVLLSNMLVSYLKVKGNCYHDVLFHIEVSGVLLCCFNSSTIHYLGIHLQVVNWHILNL